MSALPGARPRWPRPGRGWGRGERGARRSPAGRRGPGFAATRGPRSPPAGGRPGSPGPARSPAPRRDPALPGRSPSQSGPEAQRLCGRVSRALAARGGGHQRAPGGDASPGSQDRVARKSSSCKLSPANFRSANSPLQKEKKSLGSVIASLSLLVWQFLIILILCLNLHFLCSPRGTLSLGELGTSTPAAHAGRLLPSIGIGLGFHLRHWRQDFL